jgi:cytoskeletal protein RodZ
MDLKKYMKFQHPHIGKTLKSFREKKKISVENAAKKLSISKETLIKLENDELNNNSPVHYRGLILKYLDFLKVDDILKFHIEELLKINKKQKNIELTIKNSILKNINLPILLRTFFIILFFLIAGAYLFLQIIFLNKEPEIEIFYPEDEFISTEKELILRGKTESKSVITINDKLIKPNNKGEFEELIYLENGTNYINISAKKNHSRKKTIIKKIIYNQ